MIIQVVKNTKDNSNWLVSEVFFGKAAPSKNSRTLFASSLVEIPERQGYPETSVTSKPLEFKRPSRQTASLHLERNPKPAPKRSAINAEKPTQNIAVSRQKEDSDETDERRDVVQDLIELDNFRSHGFRKNPIPFQSLHIIKDQKPPSTREQVNGSISGRNYASGPPEVLMRSMHDLHREDLQRQPVGMKPPKRIQQAVNQKKGDKLGQLSRIAGAKPAQMANIPVKEVKLNEKDSSAEFEYSLNSNQNGPSNSPADPGFMSAATVKPKKIIHESLELDQVIRHYHKGPRIGLYGNGSFHPPLSVRNHNRQHLRSTSYNLQNISSTLRGLL